MCIRAVCRKIDVKKCAGGRRDDHPWLTLIHFQRGMPYEREGGGGGVDSAFGLIVRSFGCVN